MDSTVSTVSTRVGGTGKTFSSVSTTAFIDAGMGEKWCNLATGVKEERNKKKERRRRGIKKERNK
jgi:hypothetical protein